MKWAATGKRAGHTLAQCAGSRRAWVLDTRECCRRRQRSSRRGIATPAPAPDRPDRPRSPSGRHPPRGAWLRRWLPGHVPRSWPRRAGPARRRRVAGGPAEGRPPELAVRTSELPGTRRPGGPLRDASAPVRQAPLLPRTHDRERRWPAGSRRTRSLERDRGRRERVSDRARARYLAAGTPSPPQQREREPSSRPGGTRSKPLKEWKRGRAARART
jgi:hypothetical protein